MVTQIDKRRDTVDRRQTSLAQFDRRGDTYE